MTETLAGQSVAHWEALLNTATENMRVAEASGDKQAEAEFRALHRSLLAAATS